MIQYFADLLQAKPGEEPSKEVAYYYASGIVLFTLIPVLVFHPFILYIFQMGIKIRVGCCSLIYKKVTKYKPGNSIQIDY